MIADLPIALPLLLGSLVVGVLKGRSRKVLAMALPLATLAQIVMLEHGNFAQVTIFTYELTLNRVDGLSLIFGYIFSFAGFLGVLYALHVKDSVQDTTALMYAGAAIGGVFAGDLITLFIFWELTAISSVFLIWARRSERAIETGIRYLVIQVGSGVVLLAGIILHVHETGSIAFDEIGLTGLSSGLMLLGIGMKCAFPLLHNWVQDSYPETTTTGVLFLSTFTTKLAIYALARGFPGTDILIPIGAVMTAFPIFFACIENDMRRVLSYSLNNQLGFMVCAIGVGSEMAINGAAGHAFANILFEGVLFMSMSAVLFRERTIRASELGGLYKSMKLSAGFCIIGSMSISAFPLFAGFVTKSLILTAVADNGNMVIWIVLLMASAGVLDHSGIKIPYFTFFHHDSGRRPKEAPWNMLIAMGIAAFLCILIGVWPTGFYALLPYATDFNPYTAPHVINQLQLLFFAILAFAVLMRTGLYPAEIMSRNLDFDWFYRRGLPKLIMAAFAPLNQIGQASKRMANQQIRSFIAYAERHHGSQGVLSRTWAVGSGVLWVSVLLAGYLLFQYF